MKKFKEFFTEAQNKHSEFYLLLAGDIKIDRTNACKIWDKCGKRDTFRHITNLDGAEFLLKNKDKNVTISAMKFGKTLTGIETKGGVVLVVKGNYEIWFPDDAFSYIDKSGKRWIQLDRYEAHYHIFGQDFFDEYLEKLQSLLEKYDIMEGLKMFNYRIYDTGHSHQMSVSKTAEFEPFVEKFYIDNKKEMDKFMKEALKMQVKMLDKYSDKITKYLVEKWNESRTSSDRKTHYLWKYDEALISNIEVEKIYFTSFGETAEFFYMVKTLKGLIDEAEGENTIEILDEVINIDEWTKSHLRKSSQIRKLLKTGFKGLFTFYNIAQAGGNIGFKPLKKLMTDEYKYAWEKLAEHGLIRDKDIFFRMK